MVVAVLFALPAMSKTSHETISSDKINAIEEFKEVVFLCNFSVKVYNKDGKLIDGYVRVDGLENNKDCTAMAARELAYYTSTYPKQKVVLTMNP